MKFALKLSLIIFLLGIAVLVLSMYSVYSLAYQNLVDDRLDYRETLVREVAVNIENHLREKVNIVKTISVAPVLKGMLKNSNLHYDEMTEAERKDEIQEKNARWKNTTAEDSPFIKEYTNNKGADYLKTQQALFEGQYGEIFLTDKHGALVASTAKLTTFAHPHKYWWKAAYNNGKGSVFLDDRGYDDSVKGYVLGFVIPVYEGNEIIGILKANLNIMGGLGNVILNMQSPDIERIQLIRSNGLVLFEEDTPPLSKEVPTDVLDQVKPRANSAFLYEDLQRKWVVGYAPISLTWGENKVGFGGSAESVDHAKGNTGEEWSVLDYWSFQPVDKELANLLTSILIIGLILTVGLALTAYLLGQKVSRPIKELVNKTNRISTGDFTANVAIRRKDEIGTLADSFNRMLKNLRTSTTSIKKLNAEIEKRKATEKQLEKAKERAERSNRAKSEFLANMSHEIRTPLNGVIGFSELLGSTNLDENQQQFVTTIIQSANTLLDIINDILDLSKIEAGKIQLNPQKTDLRTLLNECLEAVKYRAKEKELELTKNLSSYLPKTVEMDHVRLKQVLLNLLSNALKFTEEGTVILTAKPIDFEQDKQRVTLYFSVKDTGIGIEKENLKRIFESFHQVNMSTTKKYGGTGLGLSISNQLLKKMGSQLKVSSQAGVGSEFSFELNMPFYEEKEMGTETDYNKAPSIKTEEAEKESHKILIVEDNETNLEVVKQVLKRFSERIHVIEARNGIEAYKQFKAEEPDLIFMDIVMPESDGYQATAMIRQEDQTVPIIALTAKALQGEKEECINSGMDDYLSKPFSLKQLKEMLKKYL